MKLSHIVEYLKRDTGGRDPLVVDFGNLDDLNANDYRRVLLFGADNSGQVFGIEDDGSEFPDILVFKPRFETDLNPVISYPYESFLECTNEDSRKGFKIAESRIKTMDRSPITPDELILVQRNHSYYVDHLKNKFPSNQNAAMERYQLGKDIVRELSSDLTPAQARNLKEALTDCSLAEFDAHLEKVIEALVKLARTRAAAKTKESNDDH